MRFITTLTFASLFVGTLLASAVAQDKSDTQTPGNGVTSPRVRKEVKPVYTDEAKKERIQGIVAMEVIVRTDGTVGDVKILKSLDTKYGLDKQAVKAVKQWRFSPGTKDGKPVDVLVQIEMSFTLK